jgi:hypothetical protein
LRAALFTSSATSARALAEHNSKVAVRRDSVWKVFMMGSMNGN